MRLNATHLGRTNKLPRGILLAWFLAVLTPMAARGQYALTWSAQTAGGGRGTGGPYAMVTAVGSYAAIDDSSPTQAPTPNPMQWATAPYATSSSAVTMMAAEAQEPSGGVQYYFQNVTVGNGSHDSGWQSSRTYSDTGLSANTTYQYRVKARGLMRVETGYSVPLPARTEAAPGQQIPEGSAKPVSGELGSDLNLQVDPFTGSVGYTLPIALPPGRQGSEPSLALRYGGGGNGWCGVGWSLGLGAIQRDTRKGVPVARSGATFLNKYDDAKGFVVAFGAANSRLVLVNAQTHEYRAETDQAFLKYEYNATYDPNGLWTVTDKSGNKFYFGRMAGESGRTAGAALRHPQFNSSTKGENVYLWALAKIEDINGNLTYVYYTQDASRQIYLSEIRYNGHKHGPFATTHSVQFVCEDREDKSLSYATGYRIETAQRLKEIRVNVLDLTQTPAQWVRVRSYHLTYESSPSTLRSLLKSVKMCGTGDPENPESYLPPVTFDYQQKPFEFDALIDWGPLDSQGQTTARWNSPVATNATPLWHDIILSLSPFCHQLVPYGYDDTCVALCDLNGDGLPDRVLRNNTAQFAYPNNVLKAQFNTGSGFALSQNWGQIDAQGHTNDGEAELWNSPRSAWTDMFWGMVYMRIVEWNPPDPPVYGYDFNPDFADDIPVDILDINGDGLPDRVMQKSGYDFSSPNNNVLKVQFSTGFGCGQVANWGPLYAFGNTSCTLGASTYDLRAKAFNAVGATYNGDFQSTLVLLVDMNHDGLPDRVLYDLGTTHDFKVQFNSGNGFENQSGTPVVVSWALVNGQGSDEHEWLSPRAIDSGQETIVDLLDINGDGLPDRVMRERTPNQGGYYADKYDVFKVQFNTGSGFEKDANGNAKLWDWGPLSGQGNETVQWKSLQCVDKNTGTFYVDLFDINGDGLPDRVMREITANQGGDPSKYDVFKVQLNTGHGFQGVDDHTPVLGTWTGIDDQGGATADWGSPHAVIHPQYVNGNTYVTMCDINGDGLPDRVIRKKDSPYDVFKVQLNKGPFPDLLSKVKGKLGGSVHVDYKSSTDPEKHKDASGVNRLPFPVHVAYLVDANDGFGNHVLTQYDFARGFYNATRREFGGFGLTTVKEVKNGSSGLETIGTTTRTYFHQGGGYEDPNTGEWQDAGSVGKKGTPYRIEVYGNDGKLYKIATNKVEEVEVASGAGWYFAYVAQTTTIDYPGVAYTPGSHQYPADCYRARLQKWEYDTATGNLLKSIDLGEVTLGTASPDIAANLANHAYAGDTSTGDDVYVHNQYATLTNPAILNKVRMTKTASDLAGLNRLTQAFYTYDPNGRVLTEVMWLDKDRDGSVDANTAPLQYGYDVYGNRNLSIDRAGIETATTYDPNYHTFPIETVTGSFVTSTDYEIRSGLPVRTIDPAGMVAENQYDSFFWLTDVMTSAEPNGTPSLWQTHIDYHLDGIVAGASCNYVHQVHAGYEAYTYSDGLGRITQTRIKAEPNTPGEYRVAHTCYDERSNVEFQTLPFFGDGGEFAKLYSYNVYLKANSQPGPGDLIGNTGTTYFEPGALNYETTYYWKVEKLNVAGQTLATSDTWSFTTEVEEHAGWRTPENPVDPLTGVDYQRYSGFWTVLPDFGVLTPVASGTVGTFDVGFLGSGIANFAMRYTGYISIASGKGGTYTFYLRSDDGSRLYIGDTLVVNNDGLRSMISEQFGSIDLKPGKHRITVEYFDRTFLLRFVGLTASYQGPEGSGIAKQAIPAGVLYRDNPNAPPNPPGSGPSASITPRLDWSSYLSQVNWPEAQPGVHTRYDAVGRTWIVTPPTGETGSPTGFATTTYGSGTPGDPWEQVFADAEGKVTQRHFDAGGRVVQLIEVTAGGNVVTNYQYDRLGRLLTTTDHANHQFQAEYDSLGRKIRSIDPDMGTWTYTYDDAGRMLDQVDSRGNQIEFSYDDELGRVSQKRVYNGSAQLTETITYTYDQSDDPAYTVHKGQVYKVTDGQGWTKTGYDARGRAIKATRYVLAKDKSYTTQTGYDAADRVTEIIYPDTKAVIAHSYDTAGHLVRTESLWGTGANEVFYQATAFNEESRPTVVTYGNGVSTQSELYPAPRRLKRTHTSKGAANLQDISYTYDKVSNLKGVADAAHTGPPSCSLSNIQYDDLHRLVSLYSTSEGRTITYEYTAIGNINKNGEMGIGAYTYSTTQPHAVVAANGSTYSYDAAGNMITRNRSGQPNQTLTYDEENRLKQVAITGGSTVQFGYSAGGSRLWKKVNNQITNLWIGSLYEEKDAKVLCHVYAGGQLVATFEPQSGFACIVENNRYFAAIWHTGGKVLTALFGGGHLPVTVMWAAALAGIVLGLRYNRRKLFDRYGLQVHYGLRAFGGTDPWRQMVLLTLAAAVFLSSNPEAALADTPQYDPAFYYYHADHLGSSQLMTDRQGNVVQHYGYRPYGNENYHANTQAFKVSNRYTGQTLDEETGLYYYGARYYDPELARFIQADSIIPDPGSSQGLNRYTYVYNNPLKLTDPTGNYPYDSYVAAGAGAFVGAYMGAVQAGMSGGDMLMGAFVGAINGTAGYSLIQLANSNATALTSLLAGNTTPMSFAWDSQPNPTSSWQPWTSPYESPRVSDYSNNAAKPFQYDYASGPDTLASLERIKPMEILHTTLDLAGTIDPTPICDTLNAALYAGEGRWGDAATSMLGAVSFLGDMAKGGRFAVRTASFMDVTLDAGRYETRGVHYTSDLGIQSFNQMYKYTAGTGLQRHHVIEQRFTTSIDFGSLLQLSIAMTREQHQVVTNLWRNEIAYGAKGTEIATREKVLNAAAYIYRDNPEILKVLGL